MPNSRKRILPEVELANLAEHLSDISEYDESIDDSDADPWYTNSSDCESGSMASGNKRENGHNILDVRQFIRSYFL